jgi:hypothetical protein
MVKKQASRLIFRTGAEKWDTQDGFEVGMLADDWGRLNMPICLSQQGLFTHHPNTASNLYAPFNSVQLRSTQAR